MELTRLLLAALLLLTASGVSNGNLPVCNVDMAIGVGTNIMKWVKAPVASSMYTITSTASTYKPGGLTPITIKVLDLDYQYIGILLVAEAFDATVNASVNVGRWEIMDGDDFFLPATCKFGAVVHSNAELKPLEQTFYWKGTAGLGQVTFRALIKQGEQNHGNFYKPPNLVLQQGTAVAAQTVWQAAPGASCAETCGTQSMACDPTATLALNSQATLKASVGNYYACREPYLKTCAPPVAGSDSYCYYYGCTSPKTFPESEVCGRRSSDPAMNRPFCACKVGAAVRDPLPPLPAANSTLGLRLATPMELDAELTLNSLEIVDGVATIDITGPQDRWFAIGWDASYMAGAYATVVWLNNPAIRRPQNYLKIGDKGYSDGVQGWYDVRCQQALNDYCRNVGSSPNVYFSCALANVTSGYTGVYNASDNKTFSAALTSRVPCKGGKIAPFLPMTVAEYKLGDFPTGRNATLLLPSTITPLRSLVDNGRFRISFSRPVNGFGPFPNRKSFPIIWSMGIQQYFGKSPTNEFIKHQVKSETQVTVNLVPIYPVCPPSAAPTDAGPSGPPGLNSASSSLPSMLVLGSLAALGSKNWLLGVFLAVLVRPATAHNWVNTPSRAQIAAVSVPCVARVNPAPHLQVAPGQEFQLEWSTGHGDTPTAWTYWIFLAEADYNSLITITDSNLEDYLDKAPAANVISGDKWTRRHLAPYTNYAPGCLNCNNGSMFPTAFQKQLLPGDPLFIVRNTVAVAKSLQVYHRNVSQWWYPADQTAGDKRAEYQSAKYPWIIAVHKFRIPNHWPDEYDVATFRFPTNLTIGNYIAHFKWGGYRDCTDVHLNNQATANPWGLVSSSNVTATFARLDHCEFTNVLNPSTQCTKMTNQNASQCLADCLKVGSCTGVQAVLKANPANTLTYTPNYPYKKYTRNDTAFLVFPPLEYGPCDSRTIHKRASCPDIHPWCNDTILAAIQSTDYLCYGLNPYRDQDFQTTDDYVITTDPTDPGFYSTCWIRLPPGGFLPYPQPMKPAPVWRTGKRCLSCDWLSTTFAAYPLSSAPAWGSAFATECKECDLELATGCKPHTTVVEGGKMGNCSTQVNNGQSCSAVCDFGFKPFGPARVCENGVLTGFDQSCTFAGC